jgi:hypothetical protein
MPLLDSGPKQSDRTGKTETRGKEKFMSSCKQSADLAISFSVPSLNEMKLGILRQRFHVLGQVSQQLQTAERDTRRKKQP